MDPSNNQPIQQGAPAVDWSSLPGDVVNVIAGCFLATDDMDYYMDFRAVCHNWRAATVDADPRAHPADPRFLLRQWVLLDEQYPKRGEDEETVGRLFLNTTTGRYLRKELPGLVEYHFITSTGGLLVLATRSPPHAARVVNPLTASSIGFMASIPKFLRHTTACVQKFGPSLTLVVENDDSTMHFAKPDAKVFTRVEVHSMLYKVRMAWGSSGEPEMIRGLMRSITAVLKPDEIYSDGYHFLMSGGDMLLVIRRRHPSRGMDVFKVVDIERNVVEPIRCIGSRALFIGQRCLSVDAAKFPSVDGNCIFYHGGEFGIAIYMYDLITDEEKLVTNSTIGSWRPRCMDKSFPPSIIQLLMNYCTSPPWSQLAHELYGRQRYLEHTGRGV